MNIIYVFINKINKKSYVGKTKFSLEKRLAAHLVCAKNGSEFAFHRALRKHGIENFESIILENEVSDESIRERECFWIEKYSSYTSGYNCTKGGEGKIGYVTPEYVRDKIRTSNLRITPSGKTVAQETYLKRTQTILLNNPNGLKDIGKKSGITQKVNKTSNGINNANAIIVDVYDSKGKLVYTFAGDFKEKSKELNLPTRILTQSYMRGGEPIYSNKLTPKKLSNNIYKGWYALKRKKE